MIGEDAIEACTPSRPDFEARAAIAARNTADITVFISELAYRRVLAARLFVLLRVYGFLIHASFI